MSVLPETEHYEEGIYQLETTDPVVAGPDGISNLQAKQLASRTAWLKKQAEDLSTALSELGITDIPGLRDALDTQTNDTALVDERVDQLTADLNNLGIGNIRGLENKLIEHAGKDASLQQLLENLSQDLKGLGIDDIAELQSALDSNTTQTASVKQTVEQLQAGLSELSISDIANLQSTLDNNAAQASSTKQAVDQLLADMANLGITDISSLSAALNEKLGVSEKAADSQLLNGKSGNIYAPVGSVIAFAAEDPPEGWLECDGSLLSREIYAGLFSIIGTSFGLDTQEPNFKLPDLRGRFIKGQGYLIPSISLGLSPIGKYQDDQIMSHDIQLLTPRDTSSFSNPTLYPLTSSKAMGLLGIDYSLAPGYAYVRKSNFSPFQHSYAHYSGGRETQPKNVTFLYCIKY